MTRATKLFLTLSLLLNLLLAGLVAGHAGRYFMDGPQRMLRHVADGLPEDKQDLFESLMKKARADSKPIRAELDSAHQKAADLLKAEPFDKASYLEQVKHINTLRAQMMQPMADAIASMAAQCTPEERAELAEAIRRPPRRY